MEKITGEQIIEALSDMTVMELNELRKQLEEKWDVTAAAPMAMAAMPGAGAAPGAAAEEAPTSFDVILTSFGEKKIQVIKEVRAITALGLKEAKDLVEGVPKPVKEGADKEEADKLKKQIEEAGGTVEIKPA